MKFIMGKSKKIAFEIPNLPPNTKLNGNIQYTLFEYPLIDNKQGYKITWKYRLLNDKEEHQFSYICESYFYIEDDGIPINKDLLNRLLYDLYINFEIGWEDGTLGSPLQGTTLPPYELNKKDIELFVFNNITKR